MQTPTHTFGAGGSTATALCAHVVGMLSLVTIVVLASGLGERGTTTALLSLFVPAGAILLSPFGGFTSARARSALAWASGPWALAVGICALLGPLRFAFISRSVVPIAEPNPLAPLWWLALVPLLGLMAGGLRLAWSKRRPMHEAVARNGSTVFLAIGLASNVAASATLVRPSTDTWVEAQEFVLTVPSTEGRHVLPLGEDRALEIVRNPPHAAVVWIRVDATTPCAWPSSSEDHETAECPRPVYAVDSEIVVRRSDVGWLVGEDAISLDSSEPIDVAPTDVADQLSIPTPLVVSGWLGWLLALAIVFWAAPILRRRKIVHLREPWRSYAAFHPALTLLLLVATQAPLFAAWLVGF